MTRVLVLGASGMLGHKLIERLAGRFETTGAVRVRDCAISELERRTGASMTSGLDAEQPTTVRPIIDAVRPDVVINCVGIIKQRSDAKDALRSVRVNAMFPHEVNAACAERSTRFIHLSTDCVFSGDRGMYVESDRPDPVDLYGRSKLLGEVVAANAITLRTSMIGREIKNRHSLVEWFLDRAPNHTVRGFTDAIFTGLTTLALADEIGRLIEHYPELSGVFHLSADRINKYDLLGLTRDAFGLSGEIVPDRTFHCDRSLVSDRYREATGFRPQPWPQMIHDMARDASAYPELQALAAALCSGD